MLLRPFLGLLLALAALGPLHAQSTNPAKPSAPAKAAPAGKPTVRTPYDASLERLAEILGALHHLAPLCTPDQDKEMWRQQMIDLIRTETPEASRRAKLVARFNRTYRSYSEIYGKCTPSARRSLLLYMKEGETLTRDVAARFGT